MSTSPAPPEWDARVRRIEEILLREFPGELGAVDDLRWLEGTLARARQELWSERGIMLDLRNRAEAAEEQVAALRDALQRIVDLEWSTNVPFPAVVRVKEIARTALSPGGETE